MFTSPFRRKCLTLAVCLWLATPLRALADGEFDRHVAEAVRLYEDLEYELALEELERASKVPHGEDGAVAIALYKGIIIADLGRWEAAREEFRSALLLQPEAKLPLRVSPKVTLEFESQRAWALEERARKAQDTPRLAESPPAPTAPQAKSPVESPNQVAPPPTEPRAEVARPELVLLPVEARPSVTEARSRRVPVLSLVLLGAGVAAGGAGTVFGLSSRGRLEDARAAQSFADLEASHGQAQRSARTANILFGTAGAAVAGALVTWLFMGDSEAPVAQGGAR